MRRREIVELLNAELNKKQKEFSEDDFEQETTLLNDTLSAPLKDQEVGIGSVVELLMNGKKNTYFLSTTLGGTILHYQERPLLVISIFSSFASMLIGRMAGEHLNWEKDGVRREVQILAVYNV